MNYSRWATNEEITEILTKIDTKGDIKKSGVPIMYDEDSLYIKDDECHTMVIGSAGSGKIQSVLLPEVKLALKAGESLLVNDIKGELYNQLKEELDKQNYNTLVINLDNTLKSDRFNILTIPYTLYKDGNKDKAIEILDNIAYYFCAPERKNNSDPFWTNSACSLFTGLALYIFENEKEENISINRIFELSTEFDKITDYINTIKKSSPIYINLSPIALAPAETKGSIISVFGQQLKLFVTKEELSKVLSDEVLDINKIINSKTAIFVISNNNAVSKRLIPLFIYELYTVILSSNTSKRYNFILDDFENFIPIKDFNNLIVLSRGCNIKITIFIKSFITLKNIYGIENTELLKFEFGNIIYLMSNDIETIEEISKLCGKQKIGNELVPLISVEDLRMLKQFEAIVLIQRINPIKTKLIPDYKIVWK